MTEKAPCGACDACEHCPFPDCTWDGVTRAEWDAAKAEDASARHFGESKLAAQKRAYREANREKVAAQKRAYYEKHKEQIMEAQRQRRARRRAELACEH
ncbi:MAG TPA: hypothetical protein H9945_05065 [Candidatus Gemmiger avicola]|uniref:Uncharacterized protein n=1 Tax=Candidatus Gemmiger avicola TaxID=2838605 RepID=A0A9D2M728_9FIRM|nr:hypothetical protein [Candidatus Gemmiger avicola]